MTVQDSTKSCKKCRNINRSVAKFCAFCGASFKEEAWTASATCVQLDASDITPVQAQQGEDEEEASPADISDRYQVKKIIYEDKCGNVFEAYDKVLDASVLFKEDRETILDEEVLVSFRKNFGKIGKKVAQISHPRMPAVREAFYQNNHYCVVMDYIEGKSLAVILRKEEGRGLKTKFALKCILAISEVVEALHTATSPLYHLNIKPSKVIINNDGKVFLIPWIPRPGKEPELIGTWGFAAPEQHHGEFDARSDVYGLGVLLHAMLSGKDPGRETPFHFMPLSILRPDLPPGIEGIVRKALNLKPEDRFPSVKDFRRNLLISAAKFLK